MESESPRSHPPVEPEDVLERAVVRDHRPALRAQLPRQAQMWIMLGLAALILLVILIAGRPDPGPRSAITTPTQPSAVPPERVRSLQERLAEQETRAQAMQAPVPTAVTRMSDSSGVAAAPTADPAVEERRRRDEESLFADNVAFSRRVSAAFTTQPAVPSANGMQPYLVGSSSPVLSPPIPPVPAGSSGESPAVPFQGMSLSQQNAKPVAPMRSIEGAEGRITILEGTVIESVLVNRLDGTFQAPVQCLVTTPVYSFDRQTVLIPAGARVLGTASPVQAWGDRRLAVSFHRLVMPDGSTHALDSFPGLNQIGETGMHDRVNRHYFQVFGASLAIGAISGLAQFGTRSGFDQSAGEASRQSAGASLATSTARVLDRYLNVLPTITIREGHRIKIVLTADLHLPPYPRTTAAGAPPPAVFSSISPSLSSGGTR